MKKTMLRIIFSLLQNRNNVLHFTMRLKRAAVYALELETAKILTFGLKDYGCEECLPGALLMAVVILESDKEEI